MKRWTSSSEEETSQIGREIAESIPEGALIYLSGDLGAGKTALVRAIAEALGCDPAEVASPSFALIHEYPRENAAPVIHVDGYRMSDHPREWLEIGIDEILRGPGVKLVEWPKRQFDELAETWGVIRVTVEEDETRVIELSR
ncbi:MAG: tRNA (adenosine(37)-N6)-threonylcarbamoyltransferase complex ATPase subunit type 1 TsaE [Thermoanaerobaculia bacterium]|nr:tRNA (adenosine(37)-N6)-threonylcarbamoyltransferase complex ATPase subunit type 1 TsaE [Thermoanaerobaculia bacterium]